MREDALPEEARPSASRAQGGRVGTFPKPRNSGQPGFLYPGRKGPQPDRGGRRGMEFREHWAAAADYNSQRPVRQPHAPSRGAPPWSCGSRGERERAALVRRLPRDFLPAAPRRQKEGGVACSPHSPEASWERAAAASPSRGTSRALPLGLCWWRSPRWAGREPRTPREAGCRGTVGLALLLPGLDAELSFPHCSVCGHINLG